MATAWATQFPPLSSSFRVTAFNPLSPENFTGIFSVSFPAISNRRLIRSNLYRRRDLVGGFALGSVLLLDSADLKAREVEVGSYLPLFSSDPSFVLFRATSNDTPALRAGNVQPYEFILPPSWKQTRVANILSGNYCQPKCAEPWVEVKFEDEKQGKVQVVASPLIRLTNKPNATIEDIGSPEKVIASLGPFVTGSTYDSDELIETSIEKHGNQTVQLENQRESAYGALMGTMLETCSSQVMVVEEANSKKQRRMQIRRMTGEEKKVIWIILRR